MVKKMLLIVNNFSVLSLRDNVVSVSFYRTLSVDFDLSESFSHELVSKGTPFRMQIQTTPIRWGSLYREEPERLT